MKIETTTPSGEKIIVSEEVGGVYGGRLKFRIIRDNKELAFWFELYLRDFEKIARCFLEKVNRGK